MGSAAPDSPETRNHHINKGMQVQFSPDLMSDFDLDLFETNCPTFNKKKDCLAVAMPNGEGGARSEVTSNKVAVRNWVARYRSDPKQLQDEPWKTALPEEAGRVNPRNDSNDLANR